MKNKRASGWTTNKLVSIILIILIMVVVIAGAISGGLTPLFSKLGDSAENVLAMLGLIEKNDASEFNGYCDDWDDNTGLSVGGRFRFCTGYCELEVSETEGYKYQQEKLYNATGYDLSELLVFDEEIKAEWNEINILDITDRLETRRGFFSSKIKHVVIFKEDETYRVNTANHEVERLNGKNWFVFDNWEMIIEGAPWLNPTISLKELKKYKEIYDYMSGECK